MYELLYTSQAAQSFSQRELVDLLLHVRGNNERRGITGILVYQEPDFMQLLEGERDVVKALYEEIERDPRHQRVKTCYEGPIERRGFASCTMAFQNTSTLDSAAVEGFSTFLEQGFTSELVSEDPSTAREFLQLLSTLVV